MSKLVIEVGDQAAADLKDLAQLDVAEGVAVLNKTTLINRALHVWAEIRRQQHAGNQLCLRDPHGNIRVLNFE